jgi:hypothetical protein
MARGRRRRKSSPVGLFVLIFGALAILVGGGVLIYNLVKKDKRGGTEGEGSELQKVIAETEKNDPKWKLQDIAAARTRLDPAKNGATLVLNIARQLPQNFGAAAEGINTRLDPTRAISEFDAQRLRQVVQGNVLAVGEARKIAFSPQGQYDLQINFQNPIDTLLPHLQDSRRVAQLLLFDSELHAAERDGSAAMQSAYALFTLARYSADEPFLICQLVRFAEGTIAIAALERAMTCANIPDDGLLAMQKLLEAEGAANAFGFALRGERASLHILAEKGVSKVSDADHAWQLQTMNRAIDLARKQLPLQSQAWEALVADLRNGSESARRVMPAFDKVHEAAARSAANMRTAAVALAAERYRRAKGDWPSSLKDLTPNYIKALPTDPFTGGQLQYFKAADGIIIYALGPNKGAFTAVGSQLHENCGLRLLNPDRRR